MSRNNLIKFLKTYVGSKSHWVEALQYFKDKDFVEPFCGSAVLSANLARTAVLNDADPIIAKFLATFDQQIVPEIFTKEDYLRVRAQPDWPSYLFALQGLSFSGVFRYSKNGYNVPPKHRDAFIEVRPLYEKALARWKELQPKVYNVDYSAIPHEDFVGRVAILDPPYETSKAAYNRVFDYAKYWDYVLNYAIKSAQAVVVFDKQENLDNQKIPIVGQRKMRVNGARPGSIESMAIFKDGSWAKAI